MSIGEIKSRRTFLTSIMDYFITIWNIQVTVIGFIIVNFTIRTTNSIRQLKASLTPRTSSSWPTETHTITIQVDNIFTVIESVLFSGCCFIWATNGIFGGLVEIFLTFKTTFVISVNISTIKHKFGEFFVVSVRNSSIF